MGEEQVRALNAPAKDNLQFSPIQSAAEADRPVWNALPTTVLKPKISIPSMTSTTKKEAPPLINREWNTSKLGLRVGADALAASAAGLLVAPIITMIDKGIIENASGRNSLGVSLKKSALEMLSQPHRFMASKPFVLIFVRYTDSILRHKTQKATSLTDHTYRVSTSVPTSPRTQSTPLPAP